jgi:hypothetical protein
MICTFEATLSLSIESMTVLVKGGAGFSKTAVSKERDFGV